MEEDFNLNYTYKLVADSPTMGPANVVIRKEDNADIPFNDENYDYQQYKAWLDAGNTPEAAD